MKRIGAFALLVGAALLATGCATKQQKSANEYYDEATGYYRDQSYPLAIETYRELLDQHPFSEHSEEAELRIAHAHYLEGEYIESIVALSDFQRRHPTSPYLPFVGYLIGRAYEQQMGTIDRDQTAARSADTYFVTVSTQYPDSPYALLAQEHLDRCRSSMAAHDFYVANFYHRTGNDLAAENRALDVLARYPASDSAADALEVLGSIYKNQGEDDRAALAYASLVEQYPTSPHAEAAKKKLAEVGGDTTELSSDPRGALLAVTGYKPGSESLDTVEVRAITEADKRPVVRPPLTSGPGPYGRSRVGL